MHVGQAHAPLWLLVVWLAAEPKDIAKAAMHLGCPCEKCLHIFVSLNQVWFHQHHKPPYAPPLTTPYPLPWPLSLYLTVPIASWTICTLPLGYWHRRACCTLHAAEYVVPLQQAVDCECVQFHANIGSMTLVSCQHVVHGLQSRQRMLTVAMHFAGVQFLRKRHAWWHLYHDHGWGKDKIWTPQRCQAVVSKWFQLARQPHLGLSNA